MVAVAGVVLTGWQRWMKAGSLAERTITERRRIIEQAARWTQEDPRSFTVFGLTSWLASIENDSTRLTYYRALKAWHSYLLLMEIRADDPMAKLPRPREPKRKPRPVATAALDRVLRHSGIRRRTRAMILLSAYGGLRVSEIAKVRGEDVDWDRLELRVVGKGGHVRWQPMPADLVALARDFPQSGWWFRSYVDPSRHLRPNCISDVMRRAMNRAGVSATAHQNRHWYATEQLAQGADIRIVQENMGHARISTTQLYTAVADQKRREAVDRLPRLGAAS